MNEPAPTLLLQTCATGSCAVLGGCWGAPRLAEPGNWVAIGQVLTQCQNAKPCRWDLTGVKRLDHTGAPRLWNAWGRQWPTQLALQPVQRAMLERVARFTTAAPARPGLSLWQMFLRQGAAVWLVLDHLAKPDLRAPGAAQAINPAWAAQLHTLGQLPHVVCKLSGLVTETSAANVGLTAGLTAADEQAILACYDLALEAFGPQRLLFGSDWPVCLVACGYARWHQLVSGWVAELSVDEQARVLGGTAMEAYRL